MTNNYICTQLLTCHVRIYALDCRKGVLVINKMNNITLDEVSAGLAYGHVICELIYSLWGYSDNATDDDACICMHPLICHVPAISTVL